MKAIIDTGIIVAGARIMAEVEGRDALELLASAARVTQEVKANAFYRDAYLKGRAKKQDEIVAMGGVLGA